MRRTLESVAAQTVPPARWVVVDDGSSDATPTILEEYAKRLPYLTVVRRADRGRRSVGPGVVETFYAGLDTVDLDSFPYLCKLDLDLDLPPRYFELLLARMRANPRLGTVSGKAYFVHPGTGQLVPEVCGDEMSVGMTKFYRTSCFREIGGFVREVMWDGIDCHRCRMLGWIAQSVDDEALRFVHLRPMASEHHGWPDTRGLRPVLHGILAAPHAGQDHFPPTEAPLRIWQLGNAVGLRLQRGARPASLRRRFLPTLPAPLPARLPGLRQARRYPAAGRGAGVGMARSA